MSVFTALKNSVDQAAIQARKSVINIKERIEAEHRELINPGERYGPLWEPPENVEVTFPHKAAICIYIYTHLM